jgi:hypothetical protein
MIEISYTIRLKVTRLNWSFTEITDAITTVTQGNYCNQQVFNRITHAEVCVELGTTTVSKARQIQKKLKTLLRLQGYKVT